MPKTVEMACFRWSPTPSPGELGCFSASTSFWLGKEMTSTLLSRNSSGVAVNTTIQAFRLVFCTASRTSGHASFTCCSVTVAASATATATAGAGVGVGVSTGRTRAAEASTGGSVGFATAAPAGTTPDDAAAPSTPIRRSSRSTRASAPRSDSSLSGTRMRATISSRWSLGEVAPVISVRAAFATSAARDNSASPNFFACTAMRSSSSCGMPRSTAAAPSAEVAATTIRSRNRSSRSSTNRRGSCPVWITRSTAVNAAAESRAPIASMTSSSSALLV